MDDDLEAIAPVAAPPNEYSGGTTRESGRPWRFAILVTLLSIIAASLLALVVLEVPQARAQRHIDCITKLGVRDAAGGRGVSKSQDELFAKQKACLGIK